MRGLRIGTTVAVALAVGALAAGPAHAERPDTGRAFGEDTKRQKSSDFPRCAAPPYCRSASCPVSRAIGACNDTSRCAQAGGRTTLISRRNRGMVTDTWSMPARHSALVQLSVARQSEQRG